MAQDNWWVSDSVAARASDPVIAEADPYKKSAEERAAEAAARDVTRTGLAVQGEERQKGQTAFSNADTLRQRYDKMPEVVKYRTVLPQLMAALKIPEDGTGDSALIYQWARVMDPLGSVREGDVELAQVGSSWAAAQEANLRKQFNIDGGGQLPPEVRAGLKRDMNQQVAELGRMYVTQRDRFEELAKRNSIDPFEVVGQHDSEPFREDYPRLGGDAVRRPGDKTGGARDPTQREVYANGLEWDIDKQEQGGDRDAYLDRMYGKKFREGEPRITAFWNGNRRNPGLTPEMAAAWYETNGYPLPSMEDMTDAVAKAKEGYQFGPIDTSAEEASYLSKLDQALEKRGADPEGVAGTVGINAAQGLTLGAGDEIAGAGGFVNELVTGGNPVAGYQAERDIIRREQERSQEARPILSTVSEIAGSLPTAGVGFAAPARAGRLAGRAAEMRGTAGAASLAKQAVRGATKAGAATGALYGFNTGEGAGGSAANALTGVVLGGAAGALGQKAAPVIDKFVGKLGRGSNALNTKGAEVMSAADDLGIEPIPALTGGVVTRKLTAGARQGFISDRPISGAVDRMTEQAGAARGRIASDVGQIADAEDAGNIVRRASDVYSTRTSAIGGNLYTRAYRRAGDTKAPLPTAVETADRWMAELAQSPIGKDSVLYKDLVKLRGQMAGGKFAIPGIRQLRTSLREEMTERGLRGSQSDKIYGDIADAAEADMVAALTAAGKTDAVAALQTASAFWKKRVETIDEVLDPLLGKKSPRSGEQILASLERLARPDSGDASRLRRMMEAMPREEAASVRATVINRMGRPTKGAAEKSEEAGFSFDTFLTNWNNMTPRARRTMFPGASIEALDKLGTVAAAAKRAGGGMNRSNTG